METKLSGSAELGSGVIRGFGGPELAGTPAQQVWSRCECAHGLCRRSSKLGFWSAAHICARQVLAENWKPSLAEVLSLGLGPGPGDGMGWTGLGAFGRRQAKKNATATRPWRRA